MAERLLLIAFGTRELNQTSLAMKKGLAWGLN
jgi:hypothetical protein